MIPNPTESPDIAACLQKDGLILEALRRGTREALRANKLAGNPVSVWRDGRVVMIPAEDIDIDGPLRDLE
ncbi:MAG: hypothetical protein ACKVS9_04825 [Phycisphaerae bacterium]